MAWSRHRSCYNFSQKKKSNHYAIIYSWMYGFPKCCNMGKLIWKGSNAKSRSIISDYGQSIIKAWSHYMIEDSYGTHLIQDAYYIRMRRVLHLYYMCMTGMQWPTQHHENLFTGISHEMRTRHTIHVGVYHSFHSQNSLNNNITACRSLHSSDRQILLAFSAVFKSYERNTH